MPIKLPLIDLGEGESGKVVELLGGRGLREKLVRMGIREGSVLAMLHVAESAGPVVVEVVGSQVALGFGMANKVVVEVDRP